MLILFLCGSTQRLEFRFEFGSVQIQGHPWYVMDQRAIGQEDNEDYAKHRDRREVEKENVKRRKISEC